VKARCSIEQAAKLLGLQTTEERSQLRAPCPACGNGGPRAIVITPETAEALGIGYAPRGLIVAIPIRLPTGELTGYIGVTEAKLPKSFTFPMWSHFPRRLLRQQPR
jgi:hypothetical protein